MFVPLWSLVPGNAYEGSNSDVNSSGGDIISSYRDSVKGTVAPNLLDTSSGETVDSELDPDTPYQETWSFLDYLKGLFESQGNSIAENREFNSLEAIKQREWATLENQAQRDWYTQMSNTAYTRSVEDLKNAGLNPILAYSNGGAAVSSTTTTPGTAASSQGVGGDTFSSILNSLANVASAVADFLPNVNKILSKVMK